MSRYKTCGGRSLKGFPSIALYIRKSTIRGYNIAIFAPDSRCNLYGSVLLIPLAWRNALGRHPKLYAWIGLCVAMVLVILITSLGARPGPLQMFFLALVGVLLASITITLIDWDDRGSSAHDDGVGDVNERDSG